MANAWLSDLVTRHRDTGIIVDTNVLLAWFVGAYDPRLLPTFKRTNTYSVDDLTLLASLLGHFKRIITLPNVLTEVNSLSNQLPDRLKPDYYAEFKNRVETYHEEYVESRIACEQPQFARCGLTDAAIIRVAEKGILVLTDDFPLANRLGQMHLDCINFNHIRSLYWYQ